jgi:putative toxin-antitoxin system antitoxin component (TIGR02293 family)
MPAGEKHFKGKLTGAKRTRMVRKLGIATDDTVKTVQLVRASFPFKVLAKFQKTTDLPWTEISRFLAIPQRTLTRRQSQGRLQADESDRVLRASIIFDMAVDLFDGNTAEARKWLQSPQTGLGNEAPLDFASTEVGAREVENLIGRLEHGIFA